MNDRAIELPKLRVLGIAGSLRSRSFNLALLRASQELAPGDITIDIFDMAAIPLYNGDLEAQGEPEPVAAFKAAIRRSDALLISTPEYNYGLPGVLKNAIDWASRPPQSALVDLPVAIMGATPGTGGTARAQLQLRQSLAATKSLVLVQQEVFVASAHQKFDDMGQLTDEDTRKYIGKLLEALAAWTRRMNEDSS